MCVHARPPAFSRAVIGGWLFVGLVLVVSAPFFAWDASAGLPGLHPLVEGLVGAFIFIGSLVTIAGSQEIGWITRAWKLDQVGLILAGSGWFAYAVFAFFANPLSIVQWLVALSFAVASALRVYTIYRDRKKTTAQVRSFQKAQEV